MSSVVECFVSKNKVLSLVLTSGKEKKEEEEKEEEEKGRGRGREECEEGWPYKRVVRR